MLRKPLALVLILVILSTAVSFGAAEETGMGSIILVTSYCQVSWQCRQIIGAVDDAGTLWYCELDDLDEMVFDDAALPAWLESADGVRMMGRLRQAELQDLLGLIRSVESQPVVSIPAADDAGSQVSFACREGRDGEREIVVLGRSGDDVYENINPNAQALYSFLRRTFPGVPAFEGEEGLAPTGFRPISLLSFCGVEQAAAAGLTVTATLDDCEAGPIPVEADRTAAQLLAITVTGKKNCLSVTGNTVTYRIMNAEGDMIAAFTFYGSLLVMNDGMYTVQ